MKSSISLWAADTHYRKGSAFLQVVHRSLPYEQPPLPMSFKDGFGPAALIFVEAGAELMRLALGWDPIAYQ